MVFTPFRVFATRFRWWPRQPSIPQFRAVLERERSRADRTGSHFSLIVFDLGGVSDPAKMASELARYFQDRLRVTDDFGHLSEDRIGVVLPDTRASGARKVATDLCGSVQKSSAQIRWEIFEYPHDEPADGNGDAVGRDSLFQPTRPVRPMVELLFQRMPLWKRALDILAASSGIVILSPLLLGCAVAVKLSSPGPIFFRQRRSGFMDQPFVIYKFRSMETDAERKQAELYHLNERDGPAFNMRNDPRVTTVGNILRRTTLDELPQLWNVLKGDMTLVGPRPLPCHESDACNGWQRRRLEVTPGLTCTWQVVKGRTGVSFADWVRMDLQYIRARSVKTDTVLMIRTIPALLLGKGAS